MKKKNNVITVSKYLEDYKELKKLNILLKNYCLSEVDVEKFKKYFFVETKEEVACLIMDGNFAYELSVFGHHITREGEVKAYNGKSYMYTANGLTTIGAKNSNYSC